MNKLSLKKVEWISIMSVGISEIDEQHKKFLDISNEGIDAHLSGNHSAVSQILNQLMDYASYHFKTEAEIMKQYNYPESSSHHDAHADFYDKVVQLQNSVSSTKEAELLDFMQNWLVLHIGSTDKLLGKYVNRNK